MGGINNNQLFSKYHCLKCGNIPSIQFKETSFSIICEEHESIDLSINEFNNNISFVYECSKCRASTSTKGIHVFYCFDCEKNFCNKCILSHDSTLIEKHFVIKAKKHYCYCKRHKKPYDKYCNKCKKNLCELCDPHTTHKILIFQNIVPNIQNINAFFTNSNNKKKLIQSKNKNEENSQLLLKAIELKEQLVNTYKIQNTNYNYINNINCIIKPKFKGHDELNDEFTKINIEKKVITKTTPIINNKKINSVWCMQTLNIINYNEKNKNKKIELIAVGCENDIILFNILDNLSIYQTINEHTNIVYSLAQFKNDEKFLFSSSKDKYLNIYKLNENQNYVLHQKLKKKVEKSGGEIGKVITLSNKLLLSGDHRSLTIWKQKEGNAEIEYEDFYNILVNGEVCNLLEMTPSIFVASKNSEKGPIQIFQNDEKEFPLMGEINDIPVHNSTTNGLSKINDNLFCVAGKEGNFYIICINPVSTKLKIKVDNQKDIMYIYVTQNKYIYCSGGENDIVQHKIIINDDKNKNDVEIVEVGRKNIYSKGLIKNNFDLSQFNSWDVRAIVPFENGNIFVESYEKKFMLFA